MDDARKWFQAQPFCTKWLLALSALIPLGSKLGLVSIYYLIYNNELIVKKFQIWRLFTAPFLTMPSLGFLLGLIMRYQYSVALETERFLGRSVDYFWFLVLMILGIGVLNLKLNLATLWDAFSMAIVYLWSKDNAQVTVRYMFGLQFKGFYLPAVMMAFSLITGGSILGDVLGILVAHSYYFLVNFKGYSLKAPKILYEMIPEFSKQSVRSTSAGYTVIPPKEQRNEEPPTARKAFIGRPRKLAE